MLPADLAGRNAGRFKAMDERLNISFDRFIRTTEEQHHRSSQEIWQRMADNGDIYLDSYSGWYSVRDEAYYAEDETVLDADDGACRHRRARRSNGSRRRAISSGSPPIRTSCSTLTNRSRISSARTRAERGDQLRQRRLAGPVDLAHHLRLGRPGSRRPRARHVCLGRCAHQLHHRRRLSRRRAIRTGITGRPTFTSSARTSSAFTRCTGRPS